MRQEPAATSEVLTPATPPDATEKLKQKALLEQPLLGPGTLGGHDSHTLRSPCPGASHWIFLPGLAEFRSQDSGGPHRSTRLTLTCCRGAEPHI